MRISIRELAEITGGKILFGNENCGFDNITTASNLIKGNDLFIPIIGEKTDGHLYIASAFENGAEVSLTQRKEAEESLSAYRTSKGLILVDSTLDALLKFAKAYKNKYLNIPFIGVTGSVGKTTTREMVSAALRGERTVYSTKNNANSQVGVPITVFETDPKAEIAVVELGISEFGEMERISAVADVETAIMTNIGISHLAQFKTQENILREKLKIISGKGESCTLLVNGDDPILAKLTVEEIHRLGIRPDKKIRILRFGFGEWNDYRAKDVVKNDGFPEFVFASGNNDLVRCALSVPGDHMIMNAIAAMAICDLYHLDLKKCASSLKEFTGFEGRGNRVMVHGVQVINDSYNASPVSMRSGLSVFEELKKTGKKIAVLADMKELGEEERKHHKELGIYIAEKIKGLDHLYVYGELAELIGKSVEEKNTGVKVSYFREMDIMKKELWNELKEGDQLFLKGSWSMGLKQLIQ